MAALLIDLCGNAITAKELAELAGLKLATVYKRIASGMTAEQVLSQRLREHDVDISEREFNFLTVLREADHRSPSGKRVFVCRCVCRKEKEVIGADLVSGRTTSCGCKRDEKARTRSIERAEDISGRFYNDIEVLGPAETTRKRSDGRNGRLWKCKCPCGKTFNALAANLRAGFYTSCGCGIVHKAKTAAMAKARAKRYPVRGKMMTLPELAAICGRGVTTIRQRMQCQGMSAERAAFGPWTRVRVAR